MKNHKRKKFVKYKNKTSLKKTYEEDEIILRQSKENFNKTSLTYYVVITLIFAFQLLWIFNGYKNRDTEFIPPNKINHNFSVLVEKIDAFDYLKQITLYGSSRVVRDIIILSEIDAKVKAIHVAQGDRIFKNDKLITLSKPQYQSQYNQAKVTMENSELEYNTVKKLYKENLSSKQNLQLAKAKYEQSAANLKIANDNLNNLLISAPFTGKIEEVYIETGEVISGYKTKIIKLLDDDKLIITGYISQSKVNNIMLNDIAYVYFPENVKVKGEVVFISSDADKDTRTFKVEILVNNINNYFKSGITAKMEIPYGKVKAYKIDSSFLALNKKGEMGIKFVENNIVKFQKVEILEENEDKMIISAFSKEIDVIAQGHGYVVEGQEVHVSYRN